MSNKDDIDKAIAWHQQAPDAKKFERATRILDIRRGRSKGKQVAFDQNRKARERSFSKGLDAMIKKVTRGK